MGVMKPRKRNAVAARRIVKVRCILTEKFFLRGLELSFSFCFFFSSSLYSSAFYFYCYLSYLAAAASPSLPPVYLLAFTPFYLKAHGLKKLCPIVSYHINNP